MSKTIDELVKEVLADEKLCKELEADMSEPQRIISFLKEHGCDANVNDFIARLDTYN
ncbi:MAG: hypothetical protein II820_11280 [Ruminiclostridium sp.]|nr:hypothetical protein [Ruminiclostridium sp.]